MSNRLSSGIGGKLEVRLRILRSRFHDGGRGNMWQVHMWMAVPVWLYTGPVVQDPVREEGKEL